MAIMITGGTGFLGSYLARHLLLEKGVGDVVLFDRYPDLRRLADAADRATVVEGDVLEPQELLAAMDRHRVERVVHLAFGVGGPAPERIVPYARVQTMGTANVFEAARLHGAVRVVNASSLAVYGPHEAASLREDDPKRPDSLYGACKLWGEHLAETYNREHGMEIVSLRPCSVFGLGRAWRGSFASGLVRVRGLPHYMALAELAARGEPIAMPPGGQLADWCYAAAEAWWPGGERGRLPHRPPPGRRLRAMAIAASGLLPRRVWSHPRTRYSIPVPASKIHTRTPRSRSCAGPCGLYLTSAARPSIVRGSTTTAPLRSVALWYCGRRSLKRTLISAAAYPRSLRYAALYP